MKDIFQEVQTNFMELGILLSGINLNTDLSDEKILEEINNALKETYKVFDKGLCETAYMCEKCNSNKDQLQKLVELINSCVKDKRMNAAANVALIEFMYTIPDTLAELRAVYFELLQKRQA